MFSYILLLWKILSFVGYGQQVKLLKYKLIHNPYSTDNLYILPFILHSFWKEQNVKRGSHTNIVKNLDKEIPGLVSTNKIEIFINSKNKYEHDLELMTSTWYKNNTDIYR